MVFNLLQNIGRREAGVDDEVRRRLVAADARRQRGDLPAQRADALLVTQALVFPTSRRREGVVDQVQLVSVVLTVQIVADLGPVGEAERLARLLRDEQTVVHRTGAVTGPELVRSGVGVDR